MILKGKVGKRVAAVNSQKLWSLVLQNIGSSEYFMSGGSNNSLAPNYVPSLFKRMKALGKHRLEAQMAKC